MDKEELMDYLQINIGRQYCSCWNVTTWDGVHHEYCFIRQLADWIFEHFDPKPLTNQEQGIQEG